MLIVKPIRIVEKEVLPTVCLFFLGPCTPNTSQNHMVSHWLGLLAGTGLITKDLFLIFFYFAHTNNYNTLHLQFITGNCYRLQKNKRKRKTKSTKIL